MKKDDKKAGKLTVTTAKPKVDVKPPVPTTAKVGLTAPTSKAPIVKRPEPKKPVLKKPEPAGKDKKVPTVSTKPPVPKAPTKAT